MSTRKPPAKKAAKNTVVKQVATKKTSAAPKRKAPRGAMPPADIRTAFERWRELDPHPTTELEYGTPFELLVAVVLSAQATDVGVNKATRRLYPVANTPETIAALGVEGLKPYIATIGLFNTKAANVVALCERLLAEHAAGYRTGTRAPCRRGDHQRHQQGGTWHTGTLAGLVL